MGGAKKMIEGGVLESPKVNRVLGLHLWNEQPVGWFGISNGPMMAGAEIFKIKVEGKGGHAAAPHLGMDPILASAQIVCALQGIVSRNVAPVQTAVVSVCTIHAGETFNVIPPAAEMTGTIRTFESETRLRVMERFEETVSGVAKAMGCRANIDLQRLTPATINQPETASRVQAIARQLFPDAEIETANYLTMGSEDFSFLLEKVPGCFCLVGSANPEKGLDAGHHHPKFDFDEDVLPHAAALMAGTVSNLLSEK